MFPAMFKSREILHFIQGNTAFHLPVNSIISPLDDTQVVSRDVNKTIMHDLVREHVDISFSHVTFHTSFQTSPYFHTTYFVTVLMRKRDTTGRNDVFLGIKVIH